MSKRQNRPNADAKREAAREKARLQVKGLMIAWYLDRMAGEPPHRQVEDRKPYGGKVLWWLEPLVPGIVNPVLVEEAIGDGWALSVQPLDKRNT